MFICSSILSSDSDCELQLGQRSQRTLKSPEKNENINTEKNKNDLEIAGLPCSSTSVKSADLFDLTCAIEKEAFKRQEENKEVILESGTRPKSKKTFGIKRTKSHEMELQPTRSENNLEIDIFPCSNTSVTNALLVDLTCAIEKEAFKRQEENKQLILESGPRPKSKKTLGLKLSMSRQMELRPTRIINNPEIAGPCSSSSAKSPDLFDDTIEKEAYPREENEEVNLLPSTIALTKPIKREIFDKYFNDRSQRKFPGPAGLLIDDREIADDENMCEIKLLSQDVEYIESRLPNAIFASPIWTGLQSHIQHWKLNIDSIETIKKQAISGTLKGWKAQNVIAVIEAINENEPFITLRDTTDSIKCILHRDAWLKFSQYLVSACCALVIQKPSVLTLGHATKNHYLNITMDNILAIYSKKVLNRDANRTLPEGYIMSEDKYTMITTVCK